MDARAAALHIRVTGLVQGVGLRPTVWRLAHEEGLVGEVRNDGAGVSIRVGGTPEAIARLVRRLAAEAPPLARIESITTHALAAPLLDTAFRIVESQAGEPRTRVAPDAAICAACRAELLDPHARRSGYAFVNCTHCGPRFSIIEALPYDRQHTTMAGFELCAACRAEYEDPSDRRFHAQPIACAACGPRVWLERWSTPAAAPIDDPARALAEAAAALHAGHILALRGLGGFHLACDATNEAAIARLRVRKRREQKPFALMFENIEDVRVHCRVGALEQQLFESVAAPIVLLDRRAPTDVAAPLPENLAPGLDTLGCMKAYTPLHLLLLRAVGRALVMSSGNLSDEPQVTTLADARTRLRELADVALLHDREIANRIDDSLVRVAAGRARVLRRARGYAPTPLPLPPGFAQAPSVLAYGAEQKAAFCLLAHGEALLSQHIGDLDDADTHADYGKQLRLYTQLFDHRPRLLAADRHVEYRSHQLARAHAAARGLPLLEIQHHHAHIAGCMAEHGLARDCAPVIGVALDGLGLGDDDALWGGEILLADYRGFRRLASLRPVALPGGSKAMREPWRNLHAQLRAAGCELARFAALEPMRRLRDKPTAQLDHMIERGLASPLASSTGRLFDAVAAALGLCFDAVAYQAQAAMQLEALAARATLDPRHAYPFARTQVGELASLDPAPMWSALLEDLAAGVAHVEIAGRFHLGLAHAVAELAAELARGRSDTVVLAGGCMQNRVLLEQLHAYLAAHELRCLSNVEIPANDGGIALGQAVIAAALHMHENPTG